MILGLGPNTQITVELYGIELLTALGPLSMIEHLDFIPSFTPAAGTNYSQILKVDWDCHWSRLTFSPYKNTFLLLTEFASFLWCSKKLWYDYLLPSNESP